MKFIKGTALHAGFESEKKKIVKFSHLVSLSYKEEGSEYHKF